MRVRRLLTVVVALSLFSGLGAATVTPASTTTNAASTPLQISEDLTSLLDTIADVLNQFNRVLSELSQLTGGAEGGEGGEAE